MTTLEKFAALDAEVASAAAQLDRVADSLARHLAELDEVSAAVDWLGMDVRDLRGVADSLRKCHQRCGTV